MKISQPIFAIMLVGFALNMMPNYISAQFEPPMLCIGLQGPRSTGNDELIIYDIVDANGTIVVEREAANAVIIDDDTGCFTTSALPPNVYDIVFHALDSETDHLTKVVSGVNLDTDREQIILTEFGVNAVLVEGDANNDNMISAADLSILVSSLDIFSALCDGDSGYDMRADFDEDGCVTGADTSILVSNLTIRIVQGDTYP